MARTIVLILFCCLLVPIISCTHSGNIDKKNGDPDDFNFGQEMFRALRNYLVEMENGDLKAATWDRHEKELVDAINSIFKGKDVTNPEFADNDSRREDAVEALLALVDDDTLPDFTDAVGELLQEAAGNAEAMEALAEFMNTKVGISGSDLVALVRTTLKYEKARDVTTALARLQQKNPQFFQQTLALLSDLLCQLPADEKTQKLLELLATDIAQLDEKKAFRGTAHPVWLAHLDSNENPTVTIDPSSKTVFPPFVDFDHDGVCDIDGEGRPINADGEALYIPAFSEEEYQDSTGQTLIFRDDFQRAISPSGKFVFSYYDAQNTVLASLLSSLGKANERRVPRELHKMLRVSMLPLKQYSDSEGVYFGYSDEGKLLHSLTGAIRLLDKKKTRDLIRGFAIMLRDKPQDAKICFTALSKMLWAVRDKELDNPTAMALYISWLLISGEIPELQQMLSIMAKTKIEGSGFWNMRDLFNAFILENLSSLCTEVLWPLRTSLVDLQASYPQDPALAERLIANVIRIICDTTPPTPQICPVVALLLDTFVETLEQDPQLVDELQRWTKQTVTSRPMITSMGYLEKLLAMEESEVLETAMTRFLTPQEDLEHDTYGQLVRIGVGLLQCKSDIATKVRLLKMAGTLLDPERPVVMNMVAIGGRVFAAEGGEVVLQISRATFYKCHKYQRAPITLIATATVDTFQAGKPHQGKKVTAPDIAELSALTGHLLTDPDGILKRLYKVIKERHDDDG